MRKFIGFAAAGLLIVGTAVGVRAETPHEEHPGHTPGGGPAAQSNDGPNFTFGASTSYTYDINDPDTSTGENQKLYSSFEQDESFNIDMVQIGISGTRGPVTYGAKLDFGDMAKLVKNSTLDDSFAMQEMYLAVDAGPLMVTAGRMPTPIGYEVLEPWANPNISRSRAYSFQPINHDGVALSAESGNFNTMVGVVNGFAVTDPTVNNPDDEYAIVGAVGAAVGDLDLRLAGIWSEETDDKDLYEINGVLAGNYNNCRYGVEGTYFNGNNDLNALDLSMWDVTLYGGATWGPWSADLRGSFTEEIDATNGNTVAGGAHDNSIWSFTATGGYEITDGVVVRAEYRLDAATENIFADDDTIGGSPDNLDNVLSVQLLWTPATGDE
ncbi:MAG: outer membrane beta-barrel protein [Deltaproteobacteria bacterium]|nr:outer membrane beta-barrel protein [Deltaproteobacteria bacterium]